MPSTVEQILDLSGLRPERPIETGLVWAPPVVGREEGWMLFEPARRNKKRPSPRLAIDFAELSGADDSTIHGFATRWGALGIDEDGWRKHGPPYGRESIAAWRLLARRYRALLSLAAALHQKRCGEEQDWLELAAGETRYDKHFQPWVIKDPRLARNELQIFLGAAIRRFRVAPRFWWSPQTEQWRIDLDAYGLSTLPGIVTIQVMMIVADKGGLAICSGCQRFYTPDREPNRTTRNYCEREDCRKRAAWRDSKREQRARKRIETS